MPLVQANKYPYVYVIRDEAKQQAEAMYSGNEFVTSELISSYAWDTALNFICQTNKEGYLLATTTDTTYGNIGTDNRAQTGEYEADNYSNIHDLLGNCKEWTTEYSNGTTQYGLGQPVVSAPFVARGGNNELSGYAAADRLKDINSYMTYGSFRLQLYINPEN